MIELVKGKIYNNRTKKYLANVLCTFPQTYQNLIAEQEIAAFAIADEKYEDALGVEKRDYLLFMLVDINGKYNTIHDRYVNIKEGKRQFSIFLKTYRKSSLYYYDYVFGHVSGHLHCVIFKIENWKEAFDKWKVGKYSEMLSLEEMKAWKVERYKSLKDVLTKNEEARRTFKKRIAGYFGTSEEMISEESHNGEYDLPPVGRDEIFNYKFRRNAGKKSKKEVCQEES